MARETPSPSRIHNLYCTKDNLFLNDRSQMNARELEDTKLSLTASELDNSALRNVIAGLQVQLKTAESQNHDLRLKVLQYESERVRDAAAVASNRKLDLAESRATLLEDTVSALMKTNADLQKQLADTTMKVSLSESRLQHSYMDTNTVRDTIRQLAATEAALEAQYAALAHEKRENEALRLVLTARNNEISELRIALAGVGHDLRAVAAHSSLSARRASLTGVNELDATITASTTTQDLSAHAVAARIAAMQASMSAVEAKRAASLSPARRSLIPRAISPGVARLSRRDRPTHASVHAPIPQTTLPLDFPSRSPASGRQTTPHRASPVARSPVRRRSASASRYAVHSSPPSRGSLISPVNRSTTSGGRADLQHWREILEDVDRISAMQTSLAHKYR